MEAIRQVGLELRGMGHGVSVLTLDDPAASYIKEFPLTVHCLGPARIGKFSYTSCLVPWLRARLADFDAIIINGLWQYHSLGTWLALRASRMPYFVYPHGMLDPWFKRTYPLKHLKKWLYWRGAEYRVLRDARAVLFTSREECHLARQSFSGYSARERVVAFGTGTPPGQIDPERARELLFAAVPRLRDRRILLFLGRIHEKKGCDLLIRAFGRVAATQPDLHLVMAGPDPAGLARPLSALAATHGVADRICWPGMLRGELKWAAFKASEAFILPSHQENFGIAVAEALGCGTPVLISDKVNIWREIQDDGAGLVESDTAVGTEGLLRRWLSLTAAQRQQMSEAAKRCFQKRFTASAMAVDLVRVIEEAVRP